MIHFVGMLVLLVFVVFVTYHDIVHYFHVRSIFETGGRLVVIPRP